jgi:hypothetical protein
MAMYLCRWPNGEFSIVNAKTKGDAIELLDEWGNAEQAFLMRMTDCMFDFRLDDDGHIELADIGESTRGRLWDSQPPAKEAETGLGREIQKRLGAASVVVNRIVQESARKRLKSKEGEGSKPN